MIEEEKLSSDLKSEVGENNFSEQTWNTYVKSALYFVPEDETKYPTFLKAQADALKSLNGQFNHDVSTTISTQKAALEAKLLADKSKTDAKPSPTPIEQPKNDSEALKAEVDNLKKWQAEFLQKQQEQAELSEIKTKKDSVISSLKKDGSDNDEILEFVELKLAINKDSNIEDLKKEGKKIYDEKYKKIYGSTYRPGGGSANSSHTSATTKEVAEINKKNLDYRKTIKA
jgi:hypothetical protein